MSEGSPVSKLDLDALERRLLGQVDRIRQNVTKRDVIIAQNQAKINALVRKEKISAATQWTEFALRVALGTVFFIVGGIEYFLPNLLHLGINRPLYWCAIGLALLSGRSIIKLLAGLDKEG